MKVGLARVQFDPRASVFGSGNHTGLIVGSLDERVDLLIDPKEAADEVTTHLYEHYGVLPSVYVDRAGVLRYLSGRGQWQVFDGIEYGVGLTGMAYADGQPILVQDVSQDPRYREAAPGVVAELAVPLWVDRRLVGILNADVPSAIDEEQIAAVTSAARILEGAFQRGGSAVGARVVVHVAWAPCPTGGPIRIGGRAGEGGNFSGDRDRGPRLWRVVARATRGAPVRRRTGARF